MAKTIQARVLVDVDIQGVRYRSNQVITDIDADLAKSYVKAGVLDDDPAAVKYALGDGSQKAIKHKAVTAVTADSATPVDPPVV